MPKIRILVVDIIRELKKKRWNPTPLNDVLGPPLILTQETVCYDRLGFLSNTGWCSWARRTWKKAISWVSMIFSPSLLHSP